MKKALDNIFGRTPSTSSIPGIPNEPGNRFTFTANQGNILFSDVLWKANRDNQWQKRYFHLTLDSIFYGKGAKPEDATFGMKTIDVVKVERILDPRQALGKNFAFKIYSNDRILLLAAETEQKREHWVSLIENSKATSWVTQLNNVANSKMSMSSGSLMFGADSKQSVNMNGTWSNSNSVSMSTMQMRGSDGGGGGGGVDRQAYMQEVMKKKRISLDKSFSSPQLLKKQQRPNTNVSSQSIDEVSSSDAWENESALSSTFKEDSHSKAININNTTPILNRTLSETAVFIQMISSPAEKESGSSSNSGKAPKQYKPPLATTASSSMSRLQNLKTHEDYSNLDSTTNALSIFNSISPPKETQSTKSFLPIPSLSPLSLNPNGDDVSFKGSIETGKRANPVNQSDPPKIPYSFLLDNKKAEAKGGPKSNSDFSTSKSMNSEATNSIQKSQSNESSMSVSTTKKEGKGAPSSIADTINAIKREKSVKNSKDHILAKANIQESPANELFDKSLEMLSPEPIIKPSSNYPDNHAKSNISGGNNNMFATPGLAPNENGMKRSATQQKLMDLLTTMESALIDLEGDSKAAGKSTYYLLYLSNMCM